MKNTFFAALILLFNSFLVLGQEVNKASIRIDFAVRKSAFDPSFANNAEHIDSLAERIGELSRSQRHDSIRHALLLTIVGGASPEGTFQINKRLAGERQQAILKYLLENYDLDGTEIRHEGEYIDWEWLKQAVAGSDMADKQSILDILNQPEKIVGYFGNYTVDSRVPKLQRLSEGSAWRYMKKNIFPEMRFATATIDFADEVLPPLEETVVEAEPAELCDTLAIDTAEVIAVEMPLIEEDEIAVSQCLPVKHLYVKTNALRWLLAQTNIGVEYDLAPHWSVDFQAAYSAWDYFKHTLKFRTTDLKPGIRYWLSCNNDGWFFGAHFGMTWFNYAFDGKHRWQDYDRRSPALGGGIDAGYRLPLSKNGRWNVDFALSAGVYHIRYDRYLNEHNGRKVGQGTTTYFGLDNAAVTFSYRFALAKRGGAR